MTISDGLIRCDAGGVQLKLSHSSSSDGKAEISAGGTKIQLAQDGDLTIEAVGELKLKATTVKIEGDTQVTINGQIVGIN